jgi:hypothetical protein
MDMYFRQYWTDPRLDFTPGNPDLDEIVLTGDDSISDSFWKPDTFFVNEKKTANSRVSIQEQYLRMKPGGDVLKSVRWVDMAGFKSMGGPPGKCCNRDSHIICENLSIVTLLSKTFQAFDVNVYIFLYWLWSQGILY